MWTQEPVYVRQKREPASSNESAQGPTSALAAVVVIPKQARVEEAVDDQVSPPVALVDVLVHVPVDPVALAPEPLVPSDTAGEVTEVKACRVYPPHPVMLLYRHPLPANLVRRRDLGLCIGASPPCPGY